MGLKILLVDTNIDPVSGGGTGERTCQLSRSLSRAGAECTVLTLDVGTTEQRRLELPGVKIVALPCLVRRFYLPSFSCRQLRLLMAESDVVHLMGHWTFLNALAYLLARFLAKPYLVCPAGALPIFGRSSLVKRLYNLFIGGSLVRRAGARVAITAAERSQFIPYRVSEHEVVVIPNGVDPEGFMQADDQGFRMRHGLGDLPFLLFMGRLNLIKGPDLLLQAFWALGDRLAGYQLVFAGPDDGLLAALQETVRRHGLERRVHFTGYLDAEQKSLAYHAASILVIPSRQEAMSLVVLEAGICSTPVLITDQCGFDELASLGGGAVVPATAAGLEQGLLRLLCEGVPLAPMGARLREHVLDSYLWSRAAARYLEIFHQVTVPASSSAEHTAP